MPVHEAVVTLESEAHGQMVLLVTEMIPGHTFSVAGLHQFKFIDVTYHLYNGRIHGMGRDGYFDEIVASVEAFLSYQARKEKLNTSPV